jgi:AraC-like DNA-binding protein
MYCGVIAGYSKKTTSCSKKATTSNQSGEVPMDLLILMPDKLIFQPAVQNTNVALFYNFKSSTILKFVGKNELAVNREIQKVMTNTIVPANNDDSFHAIPHPLLSPFVSHYTFRRTSIPAGRYLEKAMPLRLTSSIDFFIGDAFETIDCCSGEIIPFIRCTIRGVRTGKKYLVRIHGQFISFTVKFNATGMYRLLGIPMDQFRNKAVPASDINLLPFENITRLLLYAPDIQTCINIVEPFLLQLVSRSLLLSGVTDMAVELLIQQIGTVSILQLAGNCNLSIRQLERNFVKEVGVSPKIYARMLRFQHLLQSRIVSPNQKWSALAYDNDYFDQMHLVKEFKQFLGITPSAFVPADFAF